MKAMEKRESGSAGEYPGAAGMKGWQSKQLGELCRFIDYRGKTPEKTSSGLRLITAKNVKMGYLQETPMEFVAPGSYERWMTRGIPKMGDVLFTTEAPLANVAQLDTAEKVVFAQRIIVLQPLENILDRTFLKYLLLSDIAQKRILEHGTGATVQGIKASLLKTIPIEFPSLFEQQRIVGLLDEAFEGLATAKANAEKNLQNARALFESYLQSVFSQRGPGWVETTLSRATGGIYTGPFGSLLHKSDYVENGIPLVNPAHITEVGIEPDMRKTVSQSTALRLKNYIMREGDIVIGRRGEMGRCAVVTDAEDGWLCGTGSFFIKPSSQCDTRYLVRFLRSESCKARLEKIAGGAVMPNLSNTDLGNLTFYLPPLDRQKAIVEEIDQLHEETQRLACLYEQKLAALEELKKSLLHQAFSGEL